jgi:protein disulfide-isomerase
MRRVLVLWVAAVVFTVAPTFAADVFDTDFAAAKEKAKASNRYMLLDFSGSDWCGWCIKLDEEVFSRRAFKSYARDNLVCVLLDFPRRKKLSKSLTEQNKNLSSEYGVRGFPTVLVLSPAGEIVARTGYKKGGASDYVKHLETLIDPHREANNIPMPTVKTQQSRLAARHSSRLQKLRPKILTRDESREMRMWTASNGDTLNASIVEEKGSFVVLKKDDGSTTQIQPAYLSAADRQYIADLKRAEASSDDSPKG